MKVVQKFYSFLDSNTLFDTCNEWAALIHYDSEFNVDMVPSTGSSLKLHNVVVVATGTLEEMTTLVNTIKNLKVCIDRQPGTGEEERFLSWEESIPYLYVNEKKQLSLDRNYIVVDSAPEWSYPDILFAQVFNDLGLNNILFSCEFRRSINGVIHVPGNYKEQSLGHDSPYKARVVLYNNWIKSFKQYLEEVLHLSLSQEYFNLALEKYPIFKDTSATIQDYFVSLDSRGLVVQFTPVSLDSSLSTQKTSLFGSSRRQAYGS